MDKTFFTLITFIFFTALVAFISWLKTKSHNEETADGYFLAGRGLSGIVIAGSMVLTDISAESLVGLNGGTFGGNWSLIGWGATPIIPVVILSVFLLPKYLQGGFSTLPAFLEARYDAQTRRLVSIFFVCAYTLIIIPIGLYAGSIAFNQIFDVPTVFDMSYEKSIWILVWCIGTVGALYAIFGGLKAVAISDTINGVGLLIGGLMIPIFALIYLGNGSFIEGFHQITTVSPEKLNVIGNKTDAVPFSTIFTGMFIGNMYCWCTNQAIIQRSFAAKNLAEGQKGVLYTGFIKLLTPLILMLPGTIAFHIFGNTLPNNDSAYPLLVKTVLPSWLTGFFIAVLFGAILSTFNSLLNSAATMFCIDLYKPVFKPNIKDEELVRVAKKISIVLAIFSMLIAPLFMSAPSGVYNVARKFTGYINAPIAAIVFIGFLTKKVPPLAPKIVLIFHIIMYSLLVFIFPINLHFLHIVGLLFITESIIMFICRFIKPFNKKIILEFEKKSGVDLTPWPYAKKVSIVAIVMLIWVYILLSPLGIANPQGVTNSFYIITICLCSLSILLIKKFGNYKKEKE